MGNRNTIIFQNNGNGGFDLLLLLLIIQFYIINVRIFFGCVIKMSNSDLNTFYGVK
jgi:hypothetical protein